VPALPVCVPAAAGVARPAASLVALPPFSGRAGCSPSRLGREGASTYVLKEVVEISMVPVTLVWEGRAPVRVEGVDDVVKVAR